MQPSSEENRYYKIGQRPQIFASLPVKPEDTKVVFYYDCAYYGLRPGSNLHCLSTKRLAQELDKVPGLVCPKQMIDLRKWQTNGILHLTEREFTKTDIYFMIRWLALTKENLLFVFCHKHGHLMTKFFLDKSDPSNNFAHFHPMRDSDLFNEINRNLNAIGRDPIDWSIV
jgi:uracil DNA glycosylase